jgi:hypothetical protein
MRNRAVSAAEKFFLLHKLSVKNLLSGLMAGCLAATAINSLGTPRRKVVQGPNLVTGGRKSSAPSPRFFCRGKHNGSDGPWSTPMTPVIRREG